MTQADLAMRVGFKNQSAIGNLEARATGRGGFKISQIAQVLQVPVNWLLEGPDTGGVPTLDETVNYELPQATRHTASESLTRYRSTDRDIALALVHDLPSSALREAIDHLQYLTAKHTRTEHSAGIRVPAPKAA